VFKNQKDVSGKEVKLDLLLEIGPAILPCKGREECVTSYLFSSFIYLFSCQWFACVRVRVCVFSCSRFHMVLAFNSFFFSL
jgi:hypothetical protein